MNPLHAYTKLNGWEWNYGENCQFSFMQKEKSQFFITCKVAIFHLLKFRHKWMHKRKEQKIKIQLHFNFNFYSFIKWLFHVTETTYKSELQTSMHRRKRDGLSFRMQIIENLEFHSIKKRDKWKASGWDVGKITS